MEHIGLQQVYWIEGNSIYQCDENDATIKVATFIRGPVAKLNRERREEFASAMNATQAELVKLQEQLRVAVDALKKIQSGADSDEVSTAALEQIKGK